jgi:hypothetical protein
LRRDSSAILAGPITRESWCVRRTDTYNEDDPPHTCRGWIRPSVKKPLLIRSLLARTPSCLLCNGKRVRRSSRAYGPIVGALFVAVRCQECGRRFPLPRRVAATRVRLESGIASTAPNKSAVESALQDALRSIPGDWLAEIRTAVDEGRWLVRIQGPGGATIRLSVIQQETTPDIVYDRVREALHKEGLIG